MPDPDADDVAAALRLSVSLLVRRLRQRPPLEGELTTPESAVLSRLDRGGPATSAELARAEQISAQSMGATSAELERRGLVARRADPRDGRRILLSVTPLGRRLLHDRRSARTQQIAAVLTHEFTARELHTLAAAAPLIERLAASV
jgi:DNA-binding MarR family transcriptional regulator